MTVQPAGGPAAVAAAAAAPSQPEGGAQPQTGATVEPVQSPQPQAGQAAGTAGEGESGEPAGQAGGDGAPDPWEDPEAAKAEILKLRKENGKRRVDKNSLVEETRKELAQTIGKALGLVPDDTPVDPAVLVENARTSATEAREAKVALAVFRSASSVADPNALLDSRAFLDSVKDVDPADTDAIVAAAQAAVQANPRLAAADPSTQPRLPGPNPAQGASSGQRPPTLDEQIAAATQAGNTREVMRLKAQQSVNLMNKTN